MHVVVDMRGLEKRGKQAASARTLKSGLLKGLSAPPSMKSEYTEMIRSPFMG